MAIGNAPFLVVVAILAAVVVALLITLVRRRTEASAADPTLALLQQQLTTLASHVAQLGSQIPNEVGTSLAQLRDQVGARLSENAQTLQKATGETGKLIADISHRLGEIGKGSQQILELGQEIRGLQQIFQAPKVRGGLGEMSLEVLLRQSFPNGSFTLQHPFKNGEIVDAVLNLPGGLVPIDSKFPLAAFRVLLEAASDEQRQKAARAFARDVRKHVDDIAEKYIRPAEGTLDLALMFVPAENVFYEVTIQEEPVAGDDPIGAYARRRKVLPVSPNTLYAYLQAIAYGLMGLKIEQQAREILKGLQQLHGDFAIFQDAFGLGQKHLKNAAAAFTDAGERATRIADRVEQFSRVADEVPQEESIPSRGRQR
ncbi:MAG TPA: DNA recombination protein RmuC [Candidatus Polarisedimenticolia bacterium]|nr:DNA recombination protein RmuC [Candidatus Polarisedimenticolia bacterium]